MKSKFAGHGDWPTPRGGPAITNADVRSLRAATPATFQATFEAADMFTAALLPMAQALDPFVIGPTENADDIRIRAFRSIKSFGDALFQQASNEEAA